MNKVTTTDCLIIGGGPTGIGAAMALTKLDADYLLVEKESSFGGLANSAVDKQGFTWDFGGHVQFSHYQVFDDYMKIALGENGWLEHKRKSAMLIDNVFVPYPAQNNLHLLPPKKRQSCIEGLEKVYGKGVNKSNFKTWLETTFGSEICKTFMYPYNQKVWAYPLEIMNCQWMGERVARPDLEKIYEQLIKNEQTTTWGPNATFKFPANGGTGSIWNSLGRNVLASKLNQEVVAVDVERHIATLRGGKKIVYKNLISSMPLDLLASMLNLNKHIPMVNLKHTSTHVIGFGLKGAPGNNIASMSWLYFASPDIPFYRATVFSNYSPANAPKTNTWSLMCEIAESPYRPIPTEGVIRAAEKGLLQAGLISNPELIISRWHRCFDYGYPVPTLERDSVIERILPWLEDKDIYSRGRFGAWLYEVSNQDHSFMQGWECAHRIVKGGSKELETTLYNPNYANSGYHLSSIIKGNK